MKTDGEREDSIKGEKNEIIGRIKSEKDSLPETKSVCLLCI